MSYNSSFSENPQAFGNQYTLYPYCTTVVNQAHMKTLALSDGSNMKEVRGDNKVAFCDIRTADNFGNLPADLGGSYHDFRNLLVMHITSDKPNSDALPVYFLPWATDQMFRIKLKPSPHHPKTNEKWFLGMFGGDTIMPNVFVTAAVQGCSVFVRGDPDSPVVYHVNAAGKNPPSGATLGSVEDAKFLEAAKFKHRSMKQWTALAQAEFPKEGPKIGGVRQAPDRSFAASAHIRTYMPGMMPTALQTLSQQHRNRLAADPVNDLVAVQQFGTIFGFREDRDWVFYRQTRTVVSARISGVWTDEFRDPVCIRFWPS